MDALSRHVCFQYEGNLFRDENVWETLQSLPGLCLENITTSSCLDVTNGDKMVVAAASDGSHFVMHVYRHGLVTVDIQYESPRQHSKALLKKCSFQSNKNFERKVKELFKGKIAYSRSIPSAMRRGYVCPYFIAGDYSLYEHKPLDLVFEKDSKWQNIKIYKSPVYGHILCLDDDIMLGESDEIYTKTLLGVERNCYKDKTVLILGGGDGGLLYELNKLEPKHVYMVEIDIEVIKACCQHMRGVCGNSMDELTGENYTIRIDNCLNVLSECLKQNRKFDYVINDLSEYLIDTDTVFTFDLASTAKILECSMRLLEHGGRYLSRGDGLKSAYVLEQFARDIEAGGYKYERFVIDVPSFQEKYCIFEVWKPEEQNGC